MPSWVVAVIGLAIVGALVLAARKWGVVSAEKKMVKKVIKAAKERKLVDNEVQNLTPDELLDRLRNGM